MKFALKSGLLTAAMFAFCAPAFAEPTGANHDPNMSIQHSSRTLSAPASNSCGAVAPANSTAASGGTLAAGSMIARGNSAGGAVNTGVMANVDKCNATAATSMGAAKPPAGGTAAH